MNPFPPRDGKLRSAPYLLRDLIFHLSITSVSLCCLFVVKAEAAIAVHGTSTAYYQSTTVFTAGGAPYVVGVGAAVTAASGNVTAPIPAGIVAGDRLLCIVESHDNVATSTPTGWTRLYRNRPGTEYSLAFYKTAVGTETTQAFTHTAGGSIIAQCSAYRNASTASAPTTGGLAGTGANVKSGTVTTTFANELLLMSAHLNQGATTTTGWTMSTPGGLTWTQQYASTTTLGTGTPVAGSSIGLFSATKAAVGAQAAVTATIAGTVNAASINYGALIEWKPGPVIAKPAGTVTGDLMILSIAARSSTATIYPPPGWTLLLSTTETTATTSMLSTYYKIAGASEPASYPWSTGTIESVASLVSFGGVDNTTPFDGVTALGLANTSATLTQTAPSITPASANDWLVTVHEQASTPCSAGFTNGWAPPTTVAMNEQTDSCSRTSSSTSGMGMEVNTRALTTAGVATGTEVATAAANAARGISQSMVLKPAAAIVPDHIRIQHNGGACSGSSAPAQITLIACANPLCTPPHYTVGNVANINLSPTGGTYTWAPVNPQTILAASGGINSGGITLANSSTGAAALAITGTPIPAPSFAYDCYNANSGISGAAGSAACNLTFNTDALTFAINDHTADSSQLVSLTSCKGSFASTSRSIKFWSTYLNPATGTQQGKIVAGTGNANCATGYSALGTSSGSPTTLSLTFGIGTTPTTTFSLCYPDVGQVQVNARYDGSALNTPPDAGVVILGNDQFIAAPHHFALSNIKCGNGSTYTGCIVTSPYANPGASNATGTVFMKAGNPFSMTVTAYNTNGAVTPNFGLETSPEGVILTPLANMPDLAGATTGNLTGAFGAFSGGSATGIAFAYDEVGIMTATAKLASGNYLASSSGALKEITTPSSGNIGRFISDHFVVVPDINSPVVTQADYTQVTANPAITAAPATVISVDSTAGFAIGSKVRIPTAGTSGNVFTATVTAVDSVLNTLTLDTSILTSLDGTDPVISEWGSYMGEEFDAQFTLTAKDASTNTTQNYQGAYAKLNPTAASNPLAFVAISGATNLTSRLNTSAAAMGSFNNGSATIVAPLAISRVASPDGPYTAVRIGIAPTDSDNVTMDACATAPPTGPPDGCVLTTYSSIMDPTVQASTEVRYGRMRLQNANGSELLPLPVNLALQYWSGATGGWQTNSADTLTTISAANFAFNFPVDTKNLLAACETFITVGGTAPSFTLSLSAPGSGNNGWADLTLNLGATASGTQCSALGIGAGPVATTANMPYLQYNWTGTLGNPSARATFGVYKSGPTIFRREMY